MVDKAEGDETKKKYKQLDPEQYQLPDHFWSNLWVDITESLRKFKDILLPNPESDDDKKSED